MKTPTIFTYENIVTAFKNLGHNLITWQWSRGLLFWLVLSAGTFSELAFLLASIWMSVHSMELSFLQTIIQVNSKPDNARIQLITYYASSAYVVLPVAILPLGIVTVFRHAKMWIYTKKSLCSSSLWAILYGLPTTTFLIIDLCVVGNSSNPGYVLDPNLVIARSIMAYLYGLIAIIYYYIGQEQESDRLQEKDGLNVQLSSELGELKIENKKLIAQVNNLESTLSKQQHDTDQLTKELDHKTVMLSNKEREIENQKALTDEYKNRNSALQKSVLEPSEDALQGYSEACKNWLKSGVKTASIEEITAYTGHSKRKITGANLQTSPRNKELIIVSNLINWLEKTPAPPIKERETGPILQIVNG